MNSIYHAGEIEVQTRAGVRVIARRAGNSIHGTFDRAAAEFLAEQPMMIVGSPDRAGRVWASVLAGEPGFAHALDARTARIRLLPAPGDPLAAILAGSNARPISGNAGGLPARFELGILVIDLKTRDRMRLNGPAEVDGEGGLLVHVREIYFNEKRGSLPLLRGRWDKVLKIARRLCKDDASLSTVWYRGNNHKPNSTGYNISVNRSCLKIRLYPDRAQERELEATLETCRLVYNSLLNDRKFQYDTAKVSVGRYTQQAYLPKWKQKVSDGKKDHPELKAVYSQVLQDVVHRVDLAFKAFFDRVEKGEKPGFPRLKGEGQYDSITFTQNDSFKVGDSTLGLAKIGQVKAKLHRRPWGELKNCTVRRINGKWFACLCQEIEAEPLPPSDEAVGIDVGLKTFAAFSNGEFIENPRFFRKEEKALAKAQRKLSKVKNEQQKRGSRERRKARKVVSRIHERIRNRRHDFCHQNARRIVNRFGIIAVEKLSVKTMLGNHCLAKSISDAAWSQFRCILTSKAESAGREVLAVNPAYTSQDCSGCGYRPDGLEGRTKKKLSDRWHLCPMCGLSLDRDTSAAVNILTLGQQSVASVKA